MSWFGNHGQELLIFFIFPVVGFCFNKWLSGKNILRLYLLSVVLLLPILTGYVYIILWLYQIFAVIILGCGYAILIVKVNQTAKVAITFLLSAVLFLILGFYAFLDAFSGYQVVEQTWYTDNYRIEYVIDRGFSGQPLYTYRLSKYAVVPLLVKEIEATHDEDSSKRCQIIFTESKLQFNKCNGSIKSLPN